MRSAVLLLIALCACEENHTTINNPPADDAGGASSGSTSSSGAGGCGDKPVITDCGPCPYTIVCGPNGTWGCPAECNTGGWGGGGGLGGSGAGGAVAGSGGLGGSGGMGGGQAMGTPCETSAECGQSDENPWISCGDAGYCECTKASAGWDGICKVNETAKAWCEPNGGCSGAYFCGDPAVASSAPPNCAYITTEDIYAIWCCHNG